MIKTVDVYHHQQPPKLFAWIASVSMIFLIVITQYFERGENPYLRGTGVVLLLLAGVFIFTPFILLSKYGSVKEGQSYIRSSIVVDRGLYAIIRHPQYLGYIFLGCGFALLSQHWASALLAMIGITFFILQAIHEEKYCLTQYGESYEHYLRRVSRFNIILGLIRLLLSDR